MNRIVRVPYAAAGIFSRALVAVAPRHSSKLLTALSARRGLLKRYREWADTNRDMDRPLVWLHAPSVGEGLQALPVLERFRERHADSQIVYTFFSPSAKQVAAKMGADFADYLPFDSSDAADPILDALRPSALIFSKLDVWPFLVERASLRGTKLGLLSATMPQSSGRMSRIAKAALTDAYGALDAVGAIAPGDAQRLIEVGVRPERLIVTGDTRYDQVWSRAGETSQARAQLLERFRDPRPTLVAGSTWPSDEERLLPAWVQVRRAMPAVRLIIAPHELSAKRLASIERRAATASLSVARASDPAAAQADVVLVDQYGILGDLYAVGDAAYVGGGFRGAGLHSLLEPAAFGVPVIVGPRHLDNRDAALLVAGGGAVRCTGVGDIATRIRIWFGNAEVLTKARSGARRVVESELGAADRSVEIVESLVYGTALSMIGRP